MFGGIAVEEQIHSPQCLMQYGEKGIIRYHNPKGLHLCCCFDELPFVAQESIERGGVIQRYRVSIAKEVYVVNALHLKNPCPNEQNQLSEGSFGRIELMPF